MHSSGHRTPSRLAPSLPGSLRASAKLIASSSSTALTPFTGHRRRPPPPARALPSLPEEPLTRPESWSDEFEQISYDEFRRTLLLADPSYVFPTTGKFVVVSGVIRETRLTYRYQTTRVNRLLSFLDRERISRSSRDFRSDGHAEHPNFPSPPVLTRASTHLTRSAYNLCPLRPRPPSPRHPEHGHPPIPHPSKTHLLPSTTKIRSARASHLASPSFLSNGPRCKQFLSTLSLLVTRTITLLRARLP